MKSDKCKLLISLLKSIYKYRLVIQKKIRKRGYRKRNGLRVFKKYLTIQEYLLLRLIHHKMVVHHKIVKNNLRYFIKLVLKFRCDNIIFRDYYSGLKSEKKYNFISNKSFYTHDPRNFIDVFVMKVIS